MERLAQDFDVKGKRVLVRCDFNAPLNDRGEITDDFRIREGALTIRHLLKNHAKIIVCTHLGDPGGVAVPRLRLDHIQKRLAELLAMPIQKAEDCVGEQVRLAAENLKEREILLLENLRFHLQEQDNNPDFARELARLGDLFINDAFGVSHRAHASIVGVPRFLPSGIGLLFQEEIAAFRKLLERPDHPVVAIIGGTKIESKLPVIETLLPAVDAVLVGNVIARQAIGRGVVFGEPAKVIVPLDGMPSDDQAFDIGPKTMALFCKHIQSAKTIVWAGPLGKIEEERYAAGSCAMVECIRKSKAFSIAGGGDLGGFLSAYRLRGAFSHVSTGGGAMLTFIAHGTLCGLESVASSPADGNLA